VECRVSVCARMEVEAGLQTTHPNYVVRLCPCAWVLVPTSHGKWLPSRCCCAFWRVRPPKSESGSRLHVRTVMCGVEPWREWDDEAPTLTMWGAVRSVQQFGVFGARIHKKAVVREREDWPRRRVRNS